MGKGVKKGLIPALFGAAGNGKLGIQVFIKREAEVGGRIQRVCYFQLILEMSLAIVLDDGKVEMNSYRFARSA